MASIEKVETGIYKRGASYLVPVYAGKDPFTGKERRKWATARTLEEARRPRRQMQQEVEKAGRVPAQTLTFGEFLRTRFLQEHVATLRPKTQKGYRAIIETHLAPEQGEHPGLGKVRLDRLTRDHIVRYLQDKRKTELSEQTLLHHYRVIHKALACAVEWGYVGRNVADQVPAPKPTKYHAEVLTAEQAQALLEWLKASRHRLYPLIATALGTGMRISELLALKWADVDMARRRLHLRRTLAEESVKNGPVFGTTKNEEGRPIPLAEFVRDALWDRALEVQREKDFFDQDYQDYGLVFCRPDGRPYDPRNVSQAFRKLLARYNQEVRAKAEQEGRKPAPEELLPRVRFHDLRHTCATLLLKQGVHPKVVQEILGHSRIEVTLDTYSHVLPSIAEEAAAELDKALRAAPPAEPAS
ncbi:MAG: site-specific integrase [Limnochordaceae bacterium]|nr:site-specific integrase [Limnochordaceae bacterium]